MWYHYQSHSNSYIQWLPFTGCQIKLPCLFGWSELDATFLRWIILSNFHYSSAIYSLKLFVPCALRLLKTNQLMEYASAAGFQLDSIIIYMWYANVYRSGPGMWMFIEYLYFFECAILWTLFDLLPVQIEDHGFSNSYFPFIVAEEDVCSEIRMLESVLELGETDADAAGTGKMEAKNQAIDFIHEIGWLFHRSQLTSRLGHLDPYMDLFPLKRFKWLMEFSIDHEWCAVVKKLLSILLKGVVGTGEHSSLNLALSELGLLHRAVRKNSRPLVELLLRYVPGNAGPETSFWLREATITTCLDLMLQDLQVWRLYTLQLAKMVLKMYWML